MGLKLDHSTARQIFKRWRTDMGLRQSRTVYIVGHNMAGYLGDGENYIVGTRRAAIRASRGEALRDLEGMNDGLDYMAERSTRKEAEEYRYRMTGRNGDYWLTARRGADYHYWVVEASAELRPAGKYGPGCADCERSMDVGESAYWVDQADCYVCPDCL